MHRRDVFRGALASLPSMAAGRPSSAQAPWPSAPIRLVVPFPPGGPTDIFARKYAARASPLLGQSMIVDNRAGAGGTLGTAQVARAKPDGYTLVFGSSSTHVTGPVLITPPPYDAVEDFSVFIAGIVPMLLAVHPDLPARSLGELVALVRARPGRLSYASSGIGSINHLGGELFRQVGGGLDVLHVPYRGNAPALQSTIAGETQFLLDTFGTALTHHRAGTLRIIAICADRRSSAAPDIPSAPESGLAGLLVRILNVVAAPAGTPTSVLQTLATVNRRVLGDEEFRRELMELSIEPVPDSNPEQAAQLLTREIEQWRPVIRSSGVQAG